MAANWVHKKCSGLQRLTPNPDYRCARCMDIAHPIDNRPQSEVQVGPDKLEMVASFCYLGDMLSAGGGCEMAVTTRVKTAWKKFRELLPVLTSRHLSYKTRLFVCLFVFVALRPMSTAMVIAGRSVHLTTLFSWAGLSKRLTSNLCTYFRL